MVTDLTTTPNGHYGELDGKKFKDISPLEESYRENDIKIITRAKISHQLINLRLFSQNLKIILVGLQILTK